ncbi:MAG TPA: hypothetical protein DEF06_08175, partial [Clostridiales bacterium]|nr:hypothetical protein [Clostridiales bacterium]
QDPPLEEPTAEPEMPTTAPTAVPSPQQTAERTESEQKPEIRTILIYCAMAACVLCIVIMALLSAHSQKKKRSR